LKRLLKNFSILSIGELISKTLLFATTILLANGLGSINFGKISFAQALISYFVMTVNFGMDYIAIREVAKKPDQASAFMNNVIALRMILCASAYAFLVLILYFIGMPLDTKLFILLFGLILIPNALDTTWLFQALEKMKWVAILKISKSLLLILLVMLGFLITKNLYLVSGAYVISLLLPAVLAICYFKRSFHFSPRFNPAFCRKLIYDSFPVFIMLFTVTIYFNVDVIFLEIYRGDKIVGIYSAAYKLVLLGIVPITIWLTACSPALSLHPFSWLGYRGFFFVNLLIGAASSSVLFLFSDKIIALVFVGEYSGNAGIMLLLSIVPFLSALAGSFANPLTFWGFQVYHLIATAVGAIVNIVFNWILIPRYGMSGAAVATAISECSVAVIACFFISFLGFHKRG